MFEWVRALQTDVALLALLLTVFCLAALWEQRKARSEGYAIVGGLAIKWLGALLVYTWLAIEYWIGGAERAIFLPPWARLTFLVSFLVGGSIILAAISPWWLPSRAVFWGWSAFLATLTLLLVFAA